MAAHQQIPTGTEFVGESDPFVANDGGRWFVMQNVDYKDGDGNMGATTTYLCDPHGYDTQEAAEAAMTADYEPPSDLKCTEGPWSGGFARNH